MIDIKEYGWKDIMMPADTLGLAARVTAVYRDRYELICEYGTIFGRLKTSIYYVQGEEFPTTGDFVLIQYVETGDSLIIATLPRKSFFSRRDPMPKEVEQVVAANFDTVFVMTSVNKDFNMARMDRYLTLAWQSGAVPVVILTKADLVSDIDRYIETIKENAIGVEVIAVSVVTKQGLDRLTPYLQKGDTVVFLGSSGVGKSSLLNALAEQDIMAVNEIREDDSRGRHTTTHRQLIMLRSGAMIIDTPGMRELGMWDVTSGLGVNYSDIELILERGCRFYDCNHGTEPGCAIKEAIGSGELSKERWQSYLKLKHEAKYSEDKSSFMIAKSQRNKEIAKHTRSMKKGKR